MDSDEVDDYGECDAAYLGAKSLGSAPMGIRVTPRLEQDPRFYSTPQPRRSTISRRAATLRDRLGFARGNDDDDE